MDFVQFRLIQNVQFPLTTAKKNLDFIYEI